MNRAENSAKLKRYRVYFLLYDAEGRAYNEYRTVYAIDAWEAKAIVRGSVGHRLKGKGRLTAIREI